MSNRVGDHRGKMKGQGEGPRKGVVERSLREFYGVTADPPRAGDRTLSPAGSRIPLETPSQRDPAAAHEERGVVIFAGSVSMKFGE